MRFPGTITVPDAAFEQVIESAARSFRLHGFRDIVLLGDHGDYQKNLAKVAATLEPRMGGVTGARPRDPRVLPGERHGLRQALKSRGYSDEEIGTHAGLADTSLALAIDPGLVRRDQLEAGGPGRTANGVAGDPRRATAELGQARRRRDRAATVDAIRRATAKR